MDQLTNAHARAIVDANNEANLAALALAKSDVPFQVQAITLALDIAQLPTQPYKVGFPFQSVYIPSASDNNCNVNMRINTVDSFQSALNLTRNSQLALPFQVANAYLDWAAQPGKSITLLFLVAGTFTNNSQISIQSGSISIAEGAAVVSRAVSGVSIISTASVVCPLDLTRLTETLQNQDSQSIWVGAANVTDNTGANPGIEIPSGGSFIFKNTGALYAVSKGTVTKIARMMETY